MLCKTVEMAINLKQLKEVGRFTFEPRELGVLLVHGPSTSDLDDVSDEDTYCKQEPITFVRKLLSVVAQIDIDGEKNYSEERITIEQANKVLEEELEQFARDFIANNLYLEETFEYDELNKIKRNKNDNESYCEYLKKLICEYKFAVGLNSAELIKHLSNRVSIPNTMEAAIKSIEAINKVAGKADMLKSAAAAAQIPASDTLKKQFEATQKLYDKLAIDTLYPESIRSMLESNEKISSNIT